MVRVIQGPGYGKMTILPKDAAAYIYKLFSIMSNLQTQYHFKLDFQKWTNIQEGNG